MLTLDVITVKGGFEHINNGAVDWDTIFDTPPETVKVLARTKIAIDGDRIECVPTDKEGDLSALEIYKIHKDLVQDAVDRRDLRYKAVQAIIDLIRDAIGESPRSRPI